LAGGDEAIKGLFAYLLLGPPFFLRAEHAGKKAGLCEAVPLVEAEVEYEVELQAQEAVGEEKAKERTEEQEAGNKEGQQEQVCTGGAATAPTSN
jgi:hypothetical protein